MTRRAFVEGEEGGSWVAEIREGSKAVQKLGTRSSREDALELAREEVGPERAVHVIERRPAPKARARR